MGRALSLAVCCVLVLSWHARSCCFARPSSICLIYWANRKPVFQTSFSGWFWCFYLWIAQSEREKSRSFIRYCWNMWGYVLRYYITMYFSTMFSYEYGVKAQCLEHCSWNRRIPEHWPCRENNSAPDSVVAPPGCATQWALSLMHDRGIKRRIHDKMKVFIQ